MKFLTHLQASFQEDFRDSRLHSAKGKRCGDTQTTVTSIISGMQGCYMAQELGLSSHRRLGRRLHSPYCRAQFIKGDVQRVCRRFLFHPSLLQTPECSLEFRMD
jgi:hypothetical protein